MARTVLQGLILAGVLWLASSINSQNTAIVKLQVQIESLQASMAGVPGLNDRVTKLEANQLEVIRRQNGFDAWRDRLQSSNPKLKEWQQ